MKEFLKGLFGITFFFGMIFGGCYLSSIIIQITEKIPTDILVIIFLLVISIVIIKIFKED